MKQSLQVLIGLICAGLAMSTASCTQHRMAGKQASYDFADARDIELAKAGATGDTARMEALVAAGANVDARGADGITLFFWVYGCRNKDGFEKLYELGADPLLEAKNGRTVAFYAVRDTDPAYLEILLEGGLDPDAKDPGGTGHTLLAETTAGGLWPQFELLLRYCANINLSDEFGDTAATTAPSGGSVDMLIRLLDEGYSYDLSGLGRNLDIIHYSESSPQYEWEQQAVEMLEKRGVAFPVYDGKPAPKAPPPVDPAYAMSCLERKRGFE